MHKSQSLARFLVLPENRSAFEAIHALAVGLKDQAKPPFNPLLLHGPPGTGKSHLAAGLVREIGKKRPGVQVQWLSGRDLREDPQLVPVRTRVVEKPSAVVPGEVDLLGATARAADLAIVEDLDHLPLGLAERFANYLEERVECDLPTLCTAQKGPRHLVTRQGPLPLRLTSRLSGGLVIGLEPLQKASRLRWLEELAQGRQLALSTRILNWLADSLSGGRQLEGAIAQLDALARLRQETLTLAQVREHFQVQVDASRPNMERIASRVAHYFHLPARELQTKRRFRGVLMARQVGMFLARQLTKLSLEQIGSFFGGRDHTTVLHACRKIEVALNEDAVLSGAVRQLEAELA